MQGLYQLQSPGWHYTSVFKRTEAVLREFRNSWALLPAFRYAELLRVKEGGKPWRDLMDLFFVAMMPAHRAACFRFYEGNGPQLIDRYSKRKLGKWDIQLRAQALAMLKEYPEACREEDMQFCELLQMDRGLQVFADLRLVPWMHNDAADDFKYDEQRYRDTWCRIQRD